MTHGLPRFPLHQPIWIEIYGGTRPVVVNGQDLPGGIPGPGLICSPASRGFHHAWRHAKSKAQAVGQSRVRARLKVVPKMLNKRAALQPLRMFIANLAQQRLFPQPLQPVHPAQTGSGHRVLSPGRGAAESDPNCSARAARLISGLRHSSDIAWSVTECLPDQPLRIFMAFGLNAIAAPAGSLEEPARHAAPVPRPARPSRSLRLP